MKISSLFMIIAVFIFCAGISSAQNKEYPGKQVFMESKCNSCHSVSSEDITAKTKRKDAPDLSNVGSTYRANFIEKFLKKGEKINEKNHPIAFKGSDKQLEDLAEWLESQKAGDKETKSGTTEEKGEKKSKTDTEKKSERMEKSSKDTSGTDKK